MSEMNQPPVQAAAPEKNLYAQTGERAEAWTEAETGRLKDMNDLFRESAESDLIPVLSELSRSAVLVDIGAGAATLVEEICKGQGVDYFAFDINEDFLMGRPSDSVKIHGSNEKIILPDNSVEVAYGKAVLGWSPRPKVAIGEMLRISNDKIILSEFNWGAVQPGRNSSPEEAELVEGIRDPLQKALSGLGFDSEYGPKLGQDIDEVIEEQGIAATREETVHELEEGDHLTSLNAAALGLLYQARTILERNESLLEEGEMGEDGVILIEDDDGELVPHTLTSEILSREEVLAVEENLRKLAELPSRSFTIPAIITQRVTMHHS